MNSNNNDIEEIKQFVEVRIPNIIDKWNVSNLTDEDRKEAVKEYYNLFSKSSKQYFNLKATPKLKPIPTEAAQNCKVMISSGRYKEYEMYTFKVKKIQKICDDVFDVISDYKAKIRGRVHESEYVHRIKKHNHNLKILYTLVESVEPNYASYDTLFCQWLFPHVGGVAHIGAILARFSKNFVKMGLSSALWEKLPQSWNNGKPGSKFGIVAQGLLTAYLYGAVPSDWEISPNSDIGRHEIDIKISEPISGEQKTRTYYIESKASEHGFPKKAKLTPNEAEKIEDIIHRPNNQYHVVRFGTKEHWVHLVKYELRDGNIIDVTLWYIKHS